MSLAARSLPGKIEPSRVFFGAGECTSVTAVADVASSLDSTYFTINVPASLFDSTKLAVSYYVWINLTDGASVDPAPAGLTGIQVDIAIGDAAVTVAAAIGTAINALSPKRFKVGVAGAVVTIENREMGDVTPAADVDTTFAIAQLSAGFGGDLGATQGGITLNFESEQVDITSDQTGNLILDQFYLGGSINMEMSLQETSAGLYEQLFRTTGSTFTPAGGSEVTGVGESKLFQSFLSNSGQLTLVPISSEAGDNSRNQTFWRAGALPGSVNFDNEIQVLGATFSALLDSSIDTRVNSYMFGDQDQDGLHV